MALIPWSDSLKVGVVQIDRQHEKWIGMINALHEAMREGRGKDVLGTVFNNLLVYTKTHFAMEEGLMGQYDYPVFPNHKAEHDKFTKRVLDLKTDFDNGKMVLTTQVMDFMRDWFVDHIQVTDVKLAQHLNNKGVF